MQAIRHRYQLGDIVQYSDFCNQTRLVRVTNRHRDIKNGKPGFDGVMVNPISFEPLEDPTYPLGVWGYDYQIEKIYPQGKQERKQS